MEWVVSFLLVAPGAILFLQRSTWLIDYLVWVTVLNRGIRRYVDWLGGAFNPFSPISLTPLVVSGFVLLMVLQNYRALPAPTRRIFNLFAVALTLGFAVGLLRNKLAAVYALAEYVAPLSVMGCAALAAGSERIIDRWARTIGWAAVAVSIYGWYQYYTVPPWDAFWVRSVGFEGYLGRLKPTQMVVFSTMSERGPFAGFLSFAVIPMIVSKRWRNATGWVSILVIMSAILLSYVRTAIITVGLAAVLFPVLNRGKNTLRIVILLCLAAVAGNVIISRTPSSGKIGKRLETIGSITQDGSFKGRIAIARYGARELLSNPLGTGLGSTGLAGRVNTGEVEAEAAIGDNGYFEILFALGALGGGLFFYGFWLLWRQVRILEKRGFRGELLMMFKTIFVTGAVVLFAGNWFSSAGALVFCVFAGYAARANPALFPATRKEV